MITCPNKSSKEFKRLVEYLGNETKAYGVWDAYEGNIPESYYQPKLNSESPEINQTSNLTDKEFYQIENDINRKFAELNEEESNSIYEKLSDENTKTKVFKQVDDKMKYFLQQVGVQVKSYDNIKDSNGNPIDAISKADIINKTIELNEDKRDITTLPEETAHVYTSLIEGTPMFETMMEKIGRFNIYNEVKSQYGELYNNDENKLKKEAIAKLISAQIVNQEINENDLNKDLWSKIWNKILSYIKNLFSPLKSSEIEPFINSAKQILEGRIDGLADLDKVIEMNKYSVDNMVYYQLSTEELKDKDRLTDSLEKRELSFNYEKGYFETQDGKIVKNRVEDILNKIYIKSNPDVEVSENSKITAAKLVYAHKLTATIMNNIINKKDNDITSVVDQVKAELLMNSKDIRDLSNGKPEFFYIKKDQFNEIKKGVEAIYKQINDNNDRINALVGNKDGKPKIYTEIPLYHAKDDLAEALDLMVVYPNGSVGIYSFESIKFKMHKQAGETYVEDLAYYQNDLYNAKLSQFKRILKEQYGVKHFAEGRIIPINVQTNYVSKYSDLEPINGFKLIEMGDKSGKDYLNQIPVYDELFGVFKGTKDNEKTKSIYDEDIDKVLKKMIGEKGKLYNELKRTPYDNILRSRYENMSELIKRLQLNREFGYVYKEASRMYKLLKAMETEPSTSPNYEYHLFNEFVQFADIMQGFSNAAFKDPKRLTNENKAQLRILPSLLDTIKTIAKNKIIEKLDYAEPIGIRTEIFDTGYLAGIFKQLHDYDGEVYKRVARLVEANEEEIRLKYNEFHDKITKAQLDLKEWAKANGLSEFDAYKKIYNAETGKLVSKWDKRYIEELNKARNKKDITWLRNNLEFHSDKYEEHKKKFFDYLDRTYPNKKDALKVKVIKDKYEKKHNIVFKGKPNNIAYYGSSHYMSLKDNPEYYSEEWKYMQANKPLFDFYNTLVAFNEEAKELTGKDIKKGFVAELRQDTIDRMGQVGILKALTPGSLFNSLKLSLEAREYDVSELDLDPVTKEPIPSVPLLYIDPVRDLATNKEIEDIENAIVAEGYTPGTTLYQRELNKRVNSLEIKKGKKYKSIDLTRSALLFAQTVYHNKVYNDTVDQIKSIQYLIKSGEIHSKLTGFTGNPLKDDVTGQFMKREGLSKTDMDILDKFVRMYWYGLQDEKDITKTIGEKRDKDGKLISEGKKLSGLKAYRLLSTITTMKALPFNLVAGMGNIIGLNNNFNITASEGLKFNHTQASKAWSLLLKRDEKALKLVEYFEPSGRNLAYDKALTASASKLSKIATQKNVMFMLTKPDDIYGEVTLISMMQNYGIDSEGNLRRIDKLGKDAKSLFDSAEIKDGEVFIKGISDNKSNFMHFRRQVQSAFTSINGPMAESNKNLMSARLLTRILGKFRSWMVGLAKPRFQGYKYDETTEELNVGRFRVMWGELFSDPGFTNFLGNFKNLMFETLLQMPLVARANRQLLGGKTMFKTSQNEYAAKMFHEKFLSEHPELIGKLSLEEFIELRGAKLRGMAKEIALILTLAVLSLVTKAALPDKEKDFISKMFHKNAYKFMNRGLLEMTFWTSPSSVMEILKTPAADTRTITDTWAFMKNTIFLPEDGGLERWNKSGLKLFPIVGNVIDFLDVWDKPVK